MHKRSIIALACLQFFLQAYFIYASGSWTADVSLMARPLTSMALLVVAAAVDAGIVCYVLRTIDRTTQAYADEMGAELDRMLDRYHDETAKARQRAQEVAAAVEQELAQARAALSAGDFAGTNGHLRKGLSQTLNTTPPLCDNPIIAAVITGKMEECRSAGVAFVTHLDVARDLSLPDIDVAAIIFNLIDNALHECTLLLTSGALESPSITVRITSHAGQLFIEVVNPCRRDSELVQRRQKYPLSPRGSHGLGTGIVSSLARQHGGITEFDVRDGSFVAQVMLPLAQDKSV